MELFDIVDYEDKVVGTTDKQTAHTSGQLHRVGAVYVFDDESNLYVQVHKKSGGLYDHRSVAIFRRAKLTPKVHAGKPRKN